jgi:hypothetical protein
VLCEVKNYFYKSFLLLSLLTLVYSAKAQTKTTGKRYQPVTSPNFVSGKNYYLLNLFQQIKEVRDLLTSDEVLTGIATAKQKGLTASLTNCHATDCFIASMKFSDDEISTISKRLTELYKVGNALDRLVKTHIIPSNAYVLHQTSSPASLLVKAWEQDAKGINYVIDVYAGGKKPNYPKIDSISFNVKSRAYTALMYDFNAVLADEVKNTKLFFVPSLTAATHLLEINERNDAANNEPMEVNDNRAAVTLTKTINWSKYPYTVIVVPGAGPEEPEVALSAEGMLRCRLAAQRYREGMAPFVIVSGGKVHPFKTKFNEAVEMKKFMIQTLHLPESAVIIEPHARHTTTNMRNCARLIYKYNFPFDKPGIVSTTKLQSDAIIGMAARCQKELGYVPYKLGKLVSGNALEFYPTMESMQIDWDEPLDP